MNAYVMKGMLLIALGAVLWGFSGMCSQFVQQQRMMSAEWVVAMRLVIAGVITVVAAFYQGRASIFKVFSDWKDTLRLVIFGVLGMWMCQYTYFKAIAYAGAGIATVLQYVGPALIILYISITRLTLPRVAEVVSVVLATVGTAIIALQGVWDISALDDTLLTWGMLYATTSATIEKVGYGTYRGLWHAYRRGLCVDSYTTEFRRNCMGLVDLWWVLEYHHFWHSSLF